MSTDARLQEHDIRNAILSVTRRTTNLPPQPIATISDINMPGMDGLALLREIKRRRPKLPVMMVTAYGDEERRRLASECGAADFLTKPVDFSFLKRKLRHLGTQDDPGPLS